MSKARLQKEALMLSKQLLKYPIVEKHISGGDFSKEKNAMKNTK